MAKHPIATLHYTEILHSLFPPGNQIQITFWKRDFWNKKEVEDYFKGDPSRPRSYVRHMPREITHLVNSDDLVTYSTNGDWNEAKRVLEMLAKSG